MQQVEYVCDRCKEKANQGGVTIEVEQWPAGFTHPGRMPVYTAQGRALAQAYDLCTRCAVDLAAWLRETPPVSPESTRELT